MRSLRYLVDAEGEFSPWPFTELRSVLHCTADANTFATFAATNLGFIYLVEGEHSLAVSLRPAKVCPRALVSAISWLSDFPQHRVMLSALLDDWRHRIFQNPRAVVLKLIALFRLKEAEIDQSEFLRRPQRIDDMREEGAFAQLMRAWSNAGGVFDREQLGLVAHRMLRGRFVVLEPQEDGRTLIIADWGHAYGSFDRQWLAMSRGLCFEDQPDYRYAEAAVGAYRQVLHTGEPLLDEVDAIIARPRYLRSRIQYRRLILPFWAPSGETRLLSTSLTDHNIDLRSRRAHER